MKRLKLKLWQKTLIAFLGIAVVTGSTIGAMVAYAFNGDEVNGALSPADKTLFSNDFSRLYNANHELEPVLSIVNPLKTEKVANISKDGKSFSWVGNEKQLTFNEFYKEYYKKFGDNFIQQVRYGSFNFYNEYVLAVRPDKFIEFTKWFIKNVAWGPDLITIDSFRLVPGVETRGNTIILGSHSTIQKEVSEIKFFPDAFFGSMPLFSSAGGIGNAPDALTDSVFKNIQDRKTTESYFKSIPYISAVYNSPYPSLKSFKDIFLTYKLIGKNVLVSNKPFDDKEHVILKDMSESEFNNYVENNYPEGNSEKSKLVYSDFTKYKIDSFTQPKPIKKDGKIIFQPDENKLYFNLSEVSNPKAKLIVPLDPRNVSSANSRFSADSLKELSEEDFISFLDFYDLNNYLNKSFYLYEESPTKRNYYSSEIEARNEVKNFDESKLKLWKISKFSVSDGKLHVSLTGEDKAQPKPINRSREIVFESKDMTPEKIRDFLNFKNILGYKGSLKPATITVSPEDKTIIAPKGQTYTILDRVKYQVYNEVYPNLLELVALKYPELLKTSNGPHVKQVLNSKGYYDYVIEDGEYKQFSITDRVGLPLLIYASDENFEGISIDFLKYVAAHEYGHHFTLEKSQALDQSDSAVLVSGLNPRSGAVIGSYYSISGLNNYLKARTNLEADRVDVDGKPSKTGVFTNFTFIKNDGTKEVETYEYIWGAKEGDTNIFDVIKNKKRRFLQDFEGLEEAAKLRNVRLGDLFLANSIDYNSGTVNPTIRGLNEVFVKDEKGNIVFKPATLLELYKQLTDGAGNKLTILLDRNNVPHIQVIEGKMDGKLETVDNVEKDTRQLTVTKVLVKNADGSDAIKVPLNVKLSNADTRYVLEKMQEIISQFDSLLLQRQGDNGWNKPSTILNPRQKFNSDIYVDIDKPNKSLKYTYLKQIFSRNNQNEFDPSRDSENLQNFSEILGEDRSKQRVEGRNLNINENDQLSSQLYRLFSSRIPNGVNGKLDIEKLLEDGDSMPTWFNKNTILQFVSESRNSNNNVIFTPLDSYVASDNQISDNEAFFKYITTLSELYNKDFEIKRNKLLRAGTIASTLNQGALSFDLTAGPGAARLNLDLGNALAAIFNQDNPVVDNNNVINPWRNFVQLLNDKNEPIISDASNNKGNVAWFLDPVSASSKSSSPAEFKIPNGNKILSSSQLVIGSVKKIGIDMQHPLFKGVGSVFKNAFNKNLIVKSGDKQFLTFSKLQDFVNFVAIDYSKAKRVDSKPTENNNNAATNTSKEQKFNWDINYVKSKFDIEKFKNSYPKLKDLDEQSIANILMELFAKSPLNMLTKNFKLSKDLLDNWALFSKKYGIELYNDKFKKDFEEGDTLSNVNKLNLPLVNELVKEWVTSRRVRNEEVLYDNLDLQDLLHFIGNRFWFNGLRWFDAEIPNFIPYEVSSDVKNLNATRSESKLNEIFSDYVYSLSETLTRDYVQTTYVPIEQPFGNLPTFIGNANEAMTGIDYVLDFKKLGFWKTNVIATKNVSNILSRYFNSLIFYKLNEEKNKINSEYDPKIEELDKKIKKLETDKENSLITNDFYKIEKIKADSQKIILAKQKQEKLDEKEKLLGGDLINSSNYNSNNPRNSSYFGNLSIKSNGYFKDRFQKKAIGMELYDENRNEKIDPTIRLKDFDGNPITSVPKAFLISQLYNYGLGTRTLSGLFRNKQLDALTLYGYVKNAEAEKIKKLRFINTKTGEAKYLKININNTNNIFYLKKQGDPTSKVTLHDLGYSSWVSDFALMGNYRDALLKPDQQFKLEFVDEKNNFVANVSLGPIKTISENGKEPSQSPIIIKKVEDPNATNKNDRVKAILAVDLQFNIPR